MRTAAVLNALGQAAVRGAEVDQLAHQAIRDVQALLGADGAIFVRIEPDGGPVVKAVDGLPTDWIGEPLPDDEAGRRRRALAEAGPVLIEDWHHEERFPKSPILESVGARSSISTPVRTARGVAALFGAYSARPAAFSDGDLEVIQAVSHILGQAIERETEKEDVRRHEFDELTGLPTRTVFAERVQKALLGSRDGAGVGVAILDLDRFSVINNTLGHAAGDEVLATLVPRLAEQLGSKDSLARVSGGQFAVLCEGVTERADLEACVRRLLRVIERPIVVDERELRLTASAGVACAFEAGTAADLIRDADAALHRAKERGGARMELFDSSIRSDLIERLRIESELRRALATDELEVYYQPVFLLQDRTLLGMEALLRWRHPLWGLVLPGRFLSVAEGSDLIASLGRRVLREACRQQARWANDFPGQRPPTIAVNVSPRQLIEPGFPKEVAAALEDAGVAAGRLVLEITEGTLLLTPTETARVLDELRALGVRVYLDDFGTGYSALSYLRRFAVDGLKIDSSFVADLGRDRQVQSIVEAIIGVAHALDLDIVAEGIEAQEQLDVLEELGCHVGQGHLLGRPSPPRELVHALRQSLPQITNGASPGARARGRGSTVSVQVERDAAASVTLREAADALAVSPSTIRRWSDEGRIEALRTAGGHRRFRVADIQRLRMVTRGSAVRVRGADLPDKPYPLIANLLRRSGSATLAAALKATYTGSSYGWFAESDAAADIERWLDVIASAFTSGDYSEAVEATRALLRRAELGGAPAVERITFLERFGRVLSRALAREQPPRDAVTALERLWAALRHGALEDAG